METNGEAKVKKRGVIEEWRKGNINLKSVKLWWDYLWLDDLWKSKDTGLGGYFAVRNN